MLRESSASSWACPKCLWSSQGHTLVCLWWSWHHHDPPKQTVPLRENTPLCLWAEVQRQRKVLRPDMRRLICFCGTENEGRKLQMRICIKKKDQLGDPKPQTRYKNYNVQHGFSEVVCKEVSQGEMSLCQAETHRWKVELPSRKGKNSRGNIPGLPKARKRQGRTWGRCWGADLKRETQVRSILQEADTKCADGGWNEHSDDVCRTTQLWLLPGQRRTKKRID